jgi:hypothetical protein
VYEQTVVVPARATAFTVMCQPCADVEPRGEGAGPTAQGILRLGHDLGWAACPRGHRVRVIRAGSAVPAEATTPLW